MNRVVVTTRSSDAWPHWFRWTVIALGTLLLCSCKAPHAGHPMPGPHAPNMLPPGAMMDAGAAMANFPGAGQAMAAMPLEPMPMPETVVGPWAPPGIAAPWPYDEYLRDGGDRDLAVRVMPDWHVHGMETEDTIAHYDTLDGLTVVEPSNRVYIYSPRFGAVRSVSGPRNSPSELDGR